MAPSLRMKLLAALFGSGAIAIFFVAIAHWRGILEWYCVYSDFQRLGPNEQGFQEYRHRRTGIVMVRLPGGTFQMGASEGDSLARKAEHPAHAVTLSYFFIAKYEVAQEEWMTVMDSNPSLLECVGGPIENVTWEESREFCRKADLELPTEAQWEYSCRAGTTGPYPGPIDEMGWHSENHDADFVISYHTTVGRKRPNAFGLHDMHGNVREWCLDFFNTAFYGTRDAAARNPWCIDSNEFGLHRVVRGGSAKTTLQHLRSSARGYEHQRERHPSTGFRVVYNP